MGKLDGKVAIITGAGAGIGEATARLFVKEGASIVGCDISPKAQTVIQSIIDEGGNATFVQGDVSSEEDTQRIVQTALDTYSKIDYLINIAGIVSPGRVDTHSVEEWDRTMAINVRSVFLLSKFALPALKDSQGCIVNVSSSVALKGVKERAVYSASKGAVMALSRAMAADFVNDKVRVNAICPGTTETPSLQSRIIAFDDPEKAREDFINRQPLKRFGKPEEIADGILFLVANEFCTGTILSVDGGMTGF
jgi:meso-butanediol dehydrogenase / (S,S)-butanediol dehydrogenase / diacetyl reductase